MKEKEEAAIRYIPLILPQSGADLLLFTVFQGENKRTRRRQSAAGGTEFLK